jgi:hypothetical protein
MAVYVNYVLSLKGVAKGPPTFLSEKDRLDLFEHNIHYALATADEYAWCYGERICWWEKGHPVPLPEGAVEAVRRARAKLDKGQPAGIDMVERIAAARAKEKQDSRKEKR